MRDKAGRFLKESEPWNKGTKGVMKKNSGSFKKGDTPWFIKQDKDNPVKNHKYSKEMGQKISEKMKGNNNPSYGGLSKEHKENIRVGTFNYVKNRTGIKYPNIGKEETQILNEIEEFIGLKIERQYPVCGYFADGYNKESNIVFEVDEKPKVTEKEINRENIIKNKLNCTFFRVPTYRR